MFASTQYLESTYQYFFNMPSANLAEFLWNDYSNWLINTNFTCIIVWDTLELFFNWLSTFHGTRWTIFFFGLLLFMKDPMKSCPLFKFDHSFVGPSVQRSVYASFLKANIYYFFWNWHNCYNMRNKQLTELDF